MREGTTKKKLTEDTIERIYAGWLGKVIGIRLGAPVEGWTYEKIKNVYGEIKDYPVDYRDFAADDDSNGPMFFLRALEEEADNYELLAQDVAFSLLNYASYEQGFFWWGGYGISTEHTAYLNLRNGINAPRSGSIEQNGKTVAEQIGGQIFIDTWGLVTPYNPELAAKYARVAASVTHDGNGIYGGIFIAVCISLAFEETDIRLLIRKALSHIPENCEYTRVVRSVMQYYEDNPGDWRACFHYIKENFGYDIYPGNCHIIPNAAVIILALLYGEGKYSEAITICNMCGWDTDCNAGNVGAIMGVFCGLSGIPYEQWRKPINDLLLSSSVMGTLNISDLPACASYIVKLAFAVSGQEVLENWKQIVLDEKEVCHFEYPGSTHAMRLKKKEQGENESRLEYSLMNTDEAAYRGKRSLKVVAKPLKPAEQILLYKQTYYCPKDLHDNRYDPSFTPIIYPGQMLEGSVMIPSYSQECYVQLYAYDARNNQYLEGESVLCEKGVWTRLQYKIPGGLDALLKEVGFQLTMLGDQMDSIDFTAFIDAFEYDGQADYIIDFAQEHMERWTVSHQEVSQFTKLKGLLYLDEGRLHISCSDYGEAYTGSHRWQNYSAEFTLSPLMGGHHYVNVRVQGAMHSYAIGFENNDYLVLLKNDCGYSQMHQVEYIWSLLYTYILRVEVEDNVIRVYVNGEKVMVWADEKDPYLTGAIGVSVTEGSHCQYDQITIKA